MKKPDFFIIGAPKCGTTSLAKWLGENPQIYFSPLKEPHHFSTDHHGTRIKHPRGYEALFADAGEAHRAVGEGSVSYLFSREAIANIEAYTGGNARYIVCLRNPVEMAPSLHGQLYSDNDEHILDFARAWQQNDLAYRKICELGAQLKRLYRQVPRERVFPVLLDDMKRNPRAVYLAALAFLGVEDDGRLEFAAFNTAKRTRLRALSRVPQFLHSLKLRFKIKWNFGLCQALVRANVETVKRAPLSSDLREAIIQHFREDIALLEHLLSRDLSHWIAVDSAS